MDKTVTPELISKLRALALVATPGEWYEVPFGDDPEGYGILTRPTPADAIDSVVSEPANPREQIIWRQADAQLCVLLKNNLDIILGMTGEIERLRAELASARGS